MKWALVTGAARRLGRATALELARAGWGVVINYRGEKDEAESALAEIKAAGGTGVLLHGDVAAPGADEALIKAANDLSAGNLRALVNSAALFEHDISAAIDPAMFDRQMHVNALAPAQLGHYALAASSRCFVVADAAGERHVVRSHAWDGAPIATLPEPFSQPALAVSRNGTQLAVAHSMGLAIYALPDLTPIHLVSSVFAGERMEMVVEPFAE